jgi:hypothetical protein
MTRWFAAILLVAASALSQSGRNGPPPGRQRILFIGNSLTAANDVPGLVEKLAERQESPRFECHAVVFPGYSLEDHWNKGDAARAIAGGSWSVVVLQQGPSALPESRVLLRDYVRRFDGLARRAGAKTATYMVWPSSERLSDFDDVRKSYEIAANDVSGIFLPAGEAWRAAWRHDPKLELYGPDGFHPTPQASYLAALVIYGQLAGRPVVGSPSLVSTPKLQIEAPLTPRRIQLLQESAAEVMSTKGSTQ